MNRKEFRDLLRRYLTDDCSAEERRLVDQLYDLIGEEMPLNWDDTEGVEEKMWAKIEAQTIGKMPNDTPVIQLKQINRERFVVISILIEADKCILCFIHKHRIHFS